MFKLIAFIKKWWRKHIVDVIPNDDDDEFSEKYR